MRIAIKKINIDKLLVFIYCVSAITFITFTWGRYLMIAAVGLLFFRMALSNRLIITRKDFPFLNSGLLFICFCYLSTIWAENRTYAFEMSNTICQVFVCTFVIYMYFSQTCEIRSLIKIIMFSGYVYAFVVFSDYGFTDIFRIASDSMMREGSKYGNLNYIGMIMSINILISAYDAICEKKHTYHLLAVLSLIILAVTQSRTALISLVAGICIIIYMNLKREDNQKVILNRIVLMIFLICVGLIVLQNTSFFTGINQRMFELIGTLSGKGGDHSSGIRVILMKIGLEQFKQTPILGIGINNSKLVSLRYVGHAYYLHNNYIEMLVNGGIIGFLIYYSFYMKIGIGIFRNRFSQNKEVILFTAIWFALLLMDVGTVSYYAKDIYIYFALLFAGLSNINIESNHYADN